MLAGFYRMIEFWEGAKGIGRSKEKYHFVTIIL